MTATDFTKRWCSVQMIDQVTAVFQLGAVFFLCVNIFQLYKDRELKGISMFMMTFFTVWGYWGIFMFYTLGQPFSMWTNVGIAGAYTVWLGMAIFYKFKARNVVSV